jgi:hypothetical protein
MVPASDEKAVAMDKRQTERQHVFAIASMHYSEVGHLLVD